MKKFIAWACVLVLLIAGVVTAYILNVNALKPIEEPRLNETEIVTPDNPKEETPAVETPADTIDAVFANNSWETIARVFKAGKASEYWNLGDTKEIELSDGYTYEVQIVDMTPNRYALSDGTGYSNGVLQFVQCLATNYQMNSEATNVGGFAESDMHIVLNTTVYSQLPDDLKAVISKVSVASGIGNYTIEETSESDNKLFLASEYEIFGEQNLSIGVSEGVPPFGYWALHNSTADLVKIKINNGYSAIWWWLRSPASGQLYHFCAVGVNGSAIINNANHPDGAVCPCFAF